MTQGSLREYAEVMRGSYFGASNKEKGKILDEFTRVTGCHRKPAIRLFRHGNQPNPIIYQIPLFDTTPFMAIILAIRN